MKTTKWWLRPGLLGGTRAELRVNYDDAMGNGVMKDSTPQDTALSELITQVLRWRVSEVMHDQSAAFLRVAIPEKNLHRINHMCAMTSESEDSHPIIERQGSAMLREMRRP